MPYDGTCALYSGSVHASPADFPHKIAILVEKERVRWSKMRNSVYPTEFIMKM